MSRLEQEDIRALLSVYDTQHEELVESKQRWFSNKLQEALQELAPRFKNHAVVIIEGYAGADIHLYKLKDIPPRTETLIGSKIPYLDLDTVSQSVIDNSPLLTEFVKIIDFSVEHSKLGGIEFNINPSEVRGDYQEDDGFYGVPDMYRD